MNTVNKSKMKKKTNRCKQVHMHSRVYLWTRKMEVINLIFRLLLVGEWRRGASVLERTVFGRIVMNGMIENTPLHKTEETQHVNNLECPVEIRGSSETLWSRSTSVLTQQDVSKTTRNDQSGRMISTECFGHGRDNKAQIWWFMGEGERVYQEDGYTVRQFVV